MYDTFGAVFVLTTSIYPLLSTNRNAVVGILFVQGFDKQKKCVDASDVNENLRTFAIKSTHALINFLGGLSPCLKTLWF